MQYCFFTSLLSKTNTFSQSKAIFSLEKAACYGQKNIFDRKRGTRLEKFRTAFRAARYIPCPSGVLLRTSESILFFDAAKSAFCLKKFSSHKPFAFDRKSLVLSARRTGTRSFRERKIYVKEENKACGCKSSLYGKSKFRACGIEKSGAFLPTAVFVFKNVFEPFPFFIQPSQKTCCRTLETKKRKRKLPLFCVRFRTFLSLLSRVDNDTEIGGF